MNVCLINTYDSTGGAAIACKRLMHALNAQSDIQAKMLVATGKTTDDDITRLDRSMIRKLQFNTNLVFERLQFKPYHNKVINEFYFSLANTGMDISHHPLVRSADIIHLHWINLGFLSIKGIKRLQSLGKPIVWTLHDMWTFTGGCHYSGECRNFRSGCGDCMFLRTPGPKDLSAKLNAGKSFFAQFNYVTCSHWLKDEAIHSTILQDANIQSIPNPIEAAFHPDDQAAARQFHGLDPDKKYILFGAANLEDERKGFDYLRSAIEILGQKNSNTELLLFGKNTLEDASLSLPVNSLGTLTSMEAIANVYRAADLFTIPSLQDNLPNTIMESMACGTPVVGFNSGGIPEMIDHQINGYLSSFKDVDDLANGMAYVLDHPELGAAASQKVLDTYQPAKVAGQYEELYLSLLQNNS